MAGFKEKIAYRKLKKFRQYPRHGELKPFREIRTIALVYNVEEISWKKIKSIIQFLESNAKSVTTLGYFNDKELTHEYTPNFKHMFFCNEQLNYWKLPMPNTLNSFLATEFDYLINLDVHGEMVLQAVSAYSHAKARLGLYMEDYDFCQDFMVKGDPKDAEELFEQLKPYITK